MQECPTVLTLHCTASPNRDKHLTVRLTMFVTELCEVGESKSDDDGRERALSSADDLAHVDGDLAICGPGRHDCAVAGRVSEAKTQISIVQRQGKCHWTYPDPDG
jgi:hypothetical protein